MRQLGSLSLLSLICSKQSLRHSGSTIAWPAKKGFDRISQSHQHSAWETIAFSFKSRLTEGLIIVSLRWLMVLSENQMIFEAASSGAYQKGDIKGSFQDSFDLDSSNSLACSMSHLSNLV